MEVTFLQKAVQPKGVRQFVYDVPAGVTMAEVRFDVTSVNVAAVKPLEIDSSAIISYGIEDKQTDQILYQNVLRPYKGYVKGRDIVKGTALLHNESKNRRITIMVNFIKTDTVGAKVVFYER